MSPFQKNIYFVISGLFFLFAVVQWNDPDPLICMIFYGAMSLIYILLALEKKLAYYLSVLMLITCIINMGIILPEIMKCINDGMPSIVQSMKATIPTIEYTR